MKTKTWFYLKCLVTLCSFSIILFTSACGTISGFSPTSTPIPTWTLQPTYTPYPTLTLQPTYTPYPTSTPTITPTALVPPNIGTDIKGTNWDIKVISAKADTKYLASNKKKTFNSEKGSRFITITVEYTNISQNSLEMLPETLLLICEDDTYKGFTTTPKLFENSNSPDVSDFSKGDNAVLVPAGTKYTGTFVFDFYKETKIFSFYFPETIPIPIVIN